MPARDAKHRKKPTPLSVDEALLARARRLRLNLSQVFEQGLAEAIRRRAQAEWLHRNRAALHVYDEHVERDRVFSERLRAF